MLDHSFKREWRKRKKIQILKRNVWDQLSNYDLNELLSLLQGNYQLLPLPFSIALSVRWKKDIKMQ